jgi:hypothetical protein
MHALIHGLCKGEYEGDGKVQYGKRKDL